MDIAEAFRGVVFLSLSFGAVGDVLEQCGGILGVFQNSVLVLLEQISEAF